MSEKRRSIQDIVPPARSRPIRATPPREDEEAETPEETKRTPPTHNRTRAHEGKKTFVLFGIALGILVILSGFFALASTLFHRADITVVIKSFPVSIAESFEASPDGALLSYTNESASITLSRSVPSSGVENVEERASGTIVVSNAYSTESQRLIANTRFESSDGLIYRIRAPIVVPGYTMRNGVKTAGEARVLVYADEPGADYNKETVTFTIPGLRESGQSAMYRDITARTETPISGGLVGERPVVSRTARDAAATELRNELDRAVRTALLEKNTEGNIIIPDSIQIRFVDLQDSFTENGAEVSVRADASAPVFSEDHIAQLIARENGVLYDNRLTIPTISDFTVAVSQAENTNTITLTISGDGSVKAYFDESAFINDLAGKDRRTVGSIITRYPSVADMRVAVYPFWRGELPKQPSRFNLILE